MYAWALRAQLLALTISSRNLESSKEDPGASFVGTDPPEVPELHTVVKVYSCRVSARSGAMKHLRVQQRDGRCCQHAFSSACKNRAKRTRKCQREDCATLCVCVCVCVRACVTYLGNGEGMQALI